MVNLSFNFSELATLNGEVLEQCLSENPLSYKEKVQEPQTGHTKSISVFLSAETL